MPCVSSDAREARGTQKGHTRPRGDSVAEQPCSLQVGIVVGNLAWCELRQKGRYV